MHRSFFLFLVFAFALGLRLAAAEQKKLSHASVTPGKTIRTVTVKVNEIFEDPDRWLYREANHLKISTREEVVRRELLFKEGEPFDPFLVQESERNLRAQRYLRNAKITPQFDGDSVDLLVEVQDTWTFIPQFGYSSGAGNEKRSAGLSEGDLMGLGKRIEALYEENDGRNFWEGVYEDPRVMGTDYRFLGAYFNRSDGHREVLYFGRPIRTLVDHKAWSVNADIFDTVGRLFENGDERYIFRQKTTDTTFLFTHSMGNPEVQLRRYSAGYTYQENNFEQADLGDYEDLNLDPSVVSNDPALLADNRRYTGPVFGYQQIAPDFVSLPYVDRFERVEDYNLGAELSGSVTLAPKFLGSRDDALLLSANRSDGMRLSDKRFLRGELGLSSRYSDGNLENSVIRGEAKYYHVFGALNWGDWYLGYHTLASSFFLDYGERLDRDREFLIGGDNVVRGYKAKTFTGDKRFGLNIEQRALFIEDAYKLISIGGALFFDAGGSTDESLGGLFADSVYSNIGIGLRFAFPRSSGERIFRIDLALPLRNGPDGNAAFEPQIILAGGQLFGARLRSETFGPEKASVEIGFDK